MSDQTAQGSGGYGGPDSPPVSGRGLPPGVTRRGVLRAAGAGAAVVGGGGLLEACSSSIKGASSSSSSSSTTGASTQHIVIGFIHPLTGALADFGTSDDWIVSTIQATSQYKNGFKVGGKTYPVTIKSYDTQSDPTKAGQLASQAILTDKVDLILTSSTPETVNPVATVAEKLGCPTDLRQRPVAGLVRQPGRQPDPGQVDVQAHLDDDVLPRRQRPVQRLHPDVEQDPRPAEHGQGRRLHVPQRLGRQRLPRGVAAVRRAGRLHAGRPAPLHRRADRLLLVHQPVQVEELRVLHQRAAAARLQRVLEAGRPAGLQAEAGHRGQGAAVPGAT